MNDFTKEELEYIFYCVDIVTHKNDEHDVYGKLEDKIQSLIDNYCEHESDGNIWEGNTDNNMPNEFRCVKCRKFYL